MVQNNYCYGNKLPKVNFSIPLRRNRFEHFCFEHNIPLIRIPYNAEYDLNDLKLETTRFLLTPENEQEYYNQY